MPHSQEMSSKRNPLSVASAQASRLVGAFLLTSLLSVPLACAESMSVSEYWETTAGVAALAAWCDGDRIMIERVNAVAYKVAEATPTIPAASHQLAIKHLYDKVINDHKMEWKGKEIAVDCEWWGGVRGKFLPQADSLLKEFE